MALLETYIVPLGVLLLILLLWWWSSSPNSINDRSRTDSATEPSESDNVDPIDSEITVLEYLDDLKAFKRYAEQRSSEQLSMDPFAFGFAFSRDYYDYDLNLDHEPLQISEYLKNLDSNEEQIKRSVSRTDFESRSSDEIISIIQDVLRVFRDLRARNYE